MWTAPGQARSVSVVDQPATARHASLVGSLREREHELAAVEELLERRGRMLLLEGRAGIGKTSLVEVACSRAAELGHEVLRARGSELESGFAFGVVRQLFERRLAGTDPGERETLLAGPAAAVRPLLAGEVAGALAGGVATPLAGDSSFAVLHGLYWLVVNLAARGPLLIAVDDAHWADEASLVSGRPRSAASAALTGRPGSSWELPPRTATRVPQPSTKRQPGRTSSR